MNCCPISMAYKKPEQAASMSKAAARFAPIFCWTRHAVAGKGISGVIVAQMIKSISSSRTLACSIARRAASTARSEVHCQSAAMRRSLMPERVTIHSSVVSTIFSRSAFVTTRSGTYEPVPTMCTDLVGRFDRGLRSCELVIQPLDVFDNVFVEVAFHKFGGDANGALDGLRR